MKKIMALLLAVVMIFGIVAAAPVLAEDKVAITLWTYPIGGWGKEEGVEKVLEAFKEVHPEIEVTVEYLDYQSGDDQVTAAIEAGTTPDIIMEGPERLVSNWGAKGKLVELSDLWTEESLKDISENNEAVVKACKWSDDNYYEYPLCMVAHCMAVNKELFEAADAMQYIDQETRTWTTEDFAKALQALKDYEGEEATPENLIVYCGGQGGDQGTRALVTNLYGAKFTNEDYTEWNIDSEEGKKGLQQLLDWEKEGLITADPGIQAAEELQMFANGTVAMSICWNASNGKQYAEQIEFEAYPVAFPTDQERPELCGGIWGFGIFDNGDEAKIEAAKEFIRFVADDPEQGPESVKLTGFFPVRASFGNVYEGTDDEELNKVFGMFMPYMGDYYNVTPGWTEQRTAWWNMLQQIFSGTDLDEALETYKEAATVEVAEAEESK